MRRDSKALCSPENCQPASVKPLVFDLFAGLGGWSEAFIAEGYRAVGIDIEAHNYGNGSYPGELLVRDIRSVTGADLVREYGVPVCIVSSPPCQEFSYMAMPWTKAKEKARKILADPAEQTRLCDLFNQCFRIQREVSEAAGRYVPMVVENVRGAQRWVGKAQWNFGSFYLWGDVPALMPSPSRGQRKTPVGSWDQTRKNYNPDHSWQPEEGFKSSGMNWSDQTKRGQDFTRIAGKQAMDGVKVASEDGRRTAPGKGARFTSRDCGDEGKKSTFTKTNPKGLPRILPDVLRTGSRTSKRKEASALIAKIPAPLASWIARCFKPK